MVTKLDHIVVAAASLQQGVEFVREKLGVAIPKGGEHPSMGTHNHVMQIGEDVFLEVIAINRDAAPPARPRWFGLDDPAIVKSLQQQPRLLTWVVNTSDLVALQSHMEFPTGVVTPVTRGSLNWLFAVPEDGRLLAGGMIPNVMQWQTDAHPAQNMADLNCRLRKLTIYHPYAEWLVSVLEGMQASKLVSVETIAANNAAYITAELDTPNGVCVLNSAING